MKLAALVLALLLANLGFYAWSQGWLDAVIGLHPHGDREPGRLARQFQPQALRILPPAAAPGGTACLETGPYAPADAAVAEGLLQQAGLKEGAWTRRSVGTDPPTLISLRVERADAALAAQLGALSGSVAGQALGKSFAPCAN